MNGIALFAISALLLAAPAPASAATTVRGADGQSISIASKKFSKNSTVLVSGRGFDETVGIYLAYCVLPKKGQPPTPCGGGINKDGSASSSIWISSNPPPYAGELAQPFLPGGRFNQSVTISKKIGQIDCTKRRCAIAVRADHIREGDRSADLFLPITFTTKK
jgi:hypothetical protein